FAPSRGATMIRRWTAVLLLATAVAAEPSRSPRLGTTIDVSIVNVDAVVTDRAGHRVRGLTQDDFEILENGRPQPISNFAGLSQARDAMHPQPRTIVVFVEHFRTAAFRRDAFFNGLRSFLHRSVRPGDAVRIVSFGDRLETRLEFTDRLASIDQTLDALASESGPGVDEITLRDQLIEQTFSSISAERGFSGAGRDSRRHGSASAHFRFMKTREMLASIAALMNSIAGSDAKKVLVMAVHHLEPPDLDGAAVAGDLAPSYGRRGGRDAFADFIAKTANANGVTVYALDPEGIGTTPGAELGEQESFNRRAPYMQQIADGTGGRFAWGTEIEKQLPEAAEDLDAYYSLGYRAANHNIDEARSIVVRTKNRDYFVRARREYVEK